MKNVSSNSGDREWFKEWFDSPYYDILYKNRNEAEAEGFIDLLLSYLQPASGAVMLDLACGKGRYSRYLASLGFEVVGLDLSPRSIQLARRFENEQLSFYTHDMRQVFRANYFDYVFNFFTSFGYFETEKEHIRTLKTVNAGLKQEGKFVLDFFNAEKVLKNLPVEETKSVDGITFHINKRRVEERIFKTIRFTDMGRQFEFIEKVKFYSLPHFEDLFMKAGMKVEKVFGDYYLNEYHPADSERIILVTGKREPSVVFGLD